MNIKAITFTTIILGAFAVGTLANPSLTHAISFSEFFFPNSTQNQQPSTSTTTVSKAKDDKPKTEPTSTSELDGTKPTAQENTQPVASTTTSTTPTTSSAATPGSNVTPGQSSTVIIPLSAEQSSLQMPTAAQSAVPSVSTTTIITPQSSQQRLEENNLYVEEAVTAAPAAIQLPEIVTDITSGNFTLPSILTSGAQDYNYPGKPMSSETAKKLYGFAGLLALLGGTLLGSNPKNKKRSEPKWSLDPRLHNIYENSRF
jgi:hypothetical protein